MSDQPTTATDPVPVVSPPGPKVLAGLMGISVGDLARRIEINGRPVSRRTLYKWHEAGAPFTSEGALRAWLGNHGTRVGAAQPTLAQALTSAAAGPDLAQTVPIAPAGQGASAPTSNQDGTPWSPAQLAALATRDVRSLQAEKAEIELAILRREMIHRQHVVALVGALAGEVLKALTDLVPAVLRAATDRIPGEHRSALREVLGAEIGHLRERLNEEAPRLVREAFDKPTGANP